MLFLGLFFHCVIWLGSVHTSPSTAHPPPLFHSHMSSHRVAAPGSQWNWSRVFNVQRQACCLVLSKGSGGKRELKNEARKKKAGQAIAELSKDSMHSTFLIYSVLYASIIHALINSWLKRNIIIQPCKQIHGLRWLWEAVRELTIIILNKHSQECISYLSHTTVKYCALNVGLDKHDKYNVSGDFSSCYYPIHFLFDSYICVTIQHQGQTSGGLDSQWNLTLWS